MPPRWARTMQEFGSGSAISERLLPIASAKREPAADKPYRVSFWGGTHRMLRSSLQHEAGGAASNLDGIIRAAVPGVDLRHARPIQPRQRRT